MKKKVIALGVVTFGVLCIAVGTMVLVRAQKEPFRLPTVISTAPPIQVLDAKLKEGDQSGLELVVQIYLRNKSDKSVVAFTVESGNNKDADAYGRVDISDETGPIAGPKAEFAIDVPIGNFKTGMPLRISAIVFDDGSYAGEEVAVGKLKKAVERTLKNKGRRIEE